MPELSPADIEFIKDLRRAREDERISRRDLMTLLGGGVVGAAAGGGGLAATGLASADASTSDSDGNVGLPGDPVDVFADGVDAAVVDTDELNNDIVANNQDGSTLSAKVSNALSDLKGGRGRVVINPKSDGTAWTWGSDLTITLSNYGGLEIDVAWGTKIEYDSSSTGKTVPITIDGDGQGDAYIKIDGGVWENVTGAPEAAFKLIDASNNHIEPEVVKNFQNGNNDAVGILLVNDAVWCEANRLGGKVRQTDIGVRTIPASETGGTGSDSFQDNHFDSLHLSVREKGMDLAGGVKDCQFSNPTVILNGDGAVGYFFDGDFLGSTFISPEVEDPSNQNNNNVGFRTGPNYSGRALVIGEVSGGGLETLADTSNGPIAAIEITGPNIGIGGLSGSQLKVSAGTGDVEEVGNFNTGEPIGFAQGLDFALAQDLTTTTGSNVGEIRKHSGGSNPNGAYEWDGSSWVGIGVASGTTITP